MGGMLVTALVCSLLQGDLLHDDLKLHVQAHLRCAA